jgi:hypothetical protein
MLVLSTASNEGMQKYNSTVSKFRPIPVTVSEAMGETYNTNVTIHRPILPSEIMKIVRNAGFEVLTNILGCNAVHFRRSPSNFLRNVGGRLSSCTPLQLMVEDGTFQG